MDDTAALTVIAVCTVARPEALRACLASIAALHLPLEVNLALVVVDNSAGGTSQSALEEARATLTLPLYALHEPRAGIVYARNAAVQKARALGAQRLLFIDDDETVDPQWLASMLRTADRYPHDIITGAVREYFAPQDNVPPWMRGARVFKPLVRVNESLCTAAYTGNLLLPHGVLVGDHPLFDLNFNHTGGEDEAFAMQWRKQGGKIRWCAGEWVHSLIPPSRGRMAWVLRRGYRGGSAWSRAVRLHHGSLGLMRVSAYAVLRGGRAVMTLLAGLLTLDRCRLVDGAFFTAQTLGTCVGIFGLSLNEYQRKDAP